MTMHCKDIRQRFWQLSYDTLLIADGIDINIMLYLIQSAELSPLWSILT